MIPSQRRGCPESRTSEPFSGTDSLAVQSDIAKLVETLDAKWERQLEKLAATLIQMKRAALDSDRDVLDRKDDSKDKFAEHERRLCQSKSEDPLLHDIAMELDDKEAVSANVGEDLKTLINGRFSKKLSE